MAAVDRYTPEADARILAAYALPARSYERIKAYTQIAADIGVTPSAIKARWHMIRNPTADRPRRERGPHRKQTPVADAPPPPPPSPLPTIERPAWMEPITRERLMAGR